MELSTPAAPLPVRAPGLAAVAAFTAFAALLAPAGAAGQLSQRGVYVPEASFDLAAGGAGPRDARDVAADPDGNVHVVDREGAVFVYDPSGSQQRSYGPPDLADPVAVTVGPDGSAYVLDENRKRVYVFDAAGELRTSWGGGGDNAGQLDDPKDLALGPNGYVHVLDKGQRSVHVFSVDGVFLRSVRFGEAIGDAAAVAVALDGQIFVTDKDARGWIWVLPAFADAPWGAARTGVQPRRVTFRGTELDEPLGVAVNRLGSVVVVDEDTGELWMRNVQESQPPGPNDYLYGGSGDAPGGFRRAVAVAFAGDDQVLVLDRDLRKVERVRLTTEDDRTALSPFLYPIRVTRGPEPLAGLVHAVGYDERGPVFLTGAGERSAVLARAESEEVETVHGDPALFHRPGSETRPLMPPDGYDRVLAGALSDSIVVVSDRGRDRFSVFARDDGRWLADFGRNYEDDRRLDDPVGVAVRPDGSIVVADRNNHRVVVVSPDRTQKLAEFPFREAWGLARSPRDRVVVWSENGQQVYTIDLTQGTPGMLTGTFVPARVAGAAFDDAGNLYLLDGQTGRVTAVHSDLDRILFQVGSHEEVRRPRGLAVDRDGNVYVGDGDGPRTVVYHWDVRGDAPETVTVAYEGDDAVLTWAAGPRTFIRHYRVEGAPGAGAGFRVLETPQDTTFRLEVAGVDDDFPRLLRVFPVFITGSAGEPSEPVSIVDLTARVAFEAEDWATASRDAERALALVDEGDEAAAELRWIRFRSAQAQGNHAEVVRLAESVAEQVPEAAQGDFHLVLMGAHMALEDLAGAAGELRAAAARLPPDRLQDDSLSVLPFRIYQAFDVTGAREEGLAFLREYSNALSDDVAELRQVYRDSLQVFDVRDALGDGLEALRIGEIPRAVEFFEERLASGALSPLEGVIAMQALSIAYFTLDRRRDAEEWFREIYEADPAFSFEESFPRTVRLYGLAVYDSPDMREYFNGLQEEIRPDSGDGGGGGG